MSELIDGLINKGYKQAAFKLKSNAEQFMRAWERKGYHVSYLMSSGPVVDSVPKNQYCKSAYYIMAEKDAPKPLTKKQQAELKRMEYLENLEKTDPQLYWQRYIKPDLLKRNSQIDPAIKNLVIELNDNGLYTSSSCSGHGNSRGHLFFLKRTFNGELARSIMKKYGLTGLKKEKDYMTPEREWYIIYKFDPIKGG